MTSGFRVSAVKQWTPASPPFAEGQANISGLREEISSDS